MNEFEKSLNSALPAQGHSDPMQIMFLAGQQSVVPKSQVPGRAGGWKIATGFLTAACTVLTVCLVMTQNEIQSDPIAQTSDAEAQPSADVELLSEENAPSPLAFVSVPEVSIDNPESWKQLGIRSRQLESITRQNIETAQDSEAETLSPFAFQRDLNKDVF